MLAMHVVLLDKLQVVIISPLQLRQPLSPPLLLLSSAGINQVWWYIENLFDGCAGNTQAVLVHQLSKHTTQNPFRKNRGRVVRVLFHPLKPFLFVATQNHVRVYNLAQQALAKKLIGGSGSITSMAIHPGGDHVIVGSEVMPT